ncbi:methylaspartate mutase [Actinocrinis sp.]|uniref:cobalamin B12-binding domain-containing protein n=1 Tax=Actinocrinis sp. TaxID=1920516 RepID=UPI002D6942E3|nr:methylaspartate mutase [Actinocrinis sp.]HZP50431.1 methylaspartate mutase [Actinocrinis sp.]
MATSHSGLTVLVAGGASDSHTWNLMFLQLLLEERGHRVENLGPCVPPRLLVERCQLLQPELVVIGSVNGHGYRDGEAAVRALRTEPGTAHIAAVIGGKLGVDGVRDEARRHRLLDAGFSAVFDDGDLDAFTRYLSTLTNSAGARADRPSGRAAV